LLLARVERKKAIFLAFLGAREERTRGWFASVSLPYHDRDAHRMLSPLEKKRREKKKKKPFFLFFFRLEGHMLAADSHVELEPITNHESRSSTIKSNKDERRDANFFNRMLSRRVLARVLVSTPARRWATNKTTTGIVGLEVEPNAHILLRAVYEETLKKLKAVPDSYGYKTTLSALVNERLAILQSTDDHAQIEAKFDNGRPIEESLAQAKQENELIDVIVAEKFWTNVKPEQVEIIVLPPGVHHEDRLELVRDQPKPKAQ
jgi:hypothetical protein